MPSTYDKELALEILKQILEALKKIEKRFRPITSPEKFTNSEVGMEKLDSICMQLIAIGESLKNFDKVTSKKVLSKYPEINWKRVIGMRDIITHHYFDVDAEAIFDVCQNHIGKLKKTISKISKEI
ncbi:MAG: HepT-like ribonuclease domain-containing protein [Desulfobacterales bacterium]|jgi:uncharacterized protein with HEPN domain